MALSHAEPGQPIDVAPLGAGLAGASTHAILKTRSLELMRLVLRRGQSLPPHAVPGEITLLCIEGAVALDCGGRSTELRAHQVVLLRGSEEHAVRALEDASLLLTIQIPPGQPGSASSTTAAGPAGSAMDRDRPAARVQPSEAQRRDAPSLEERVEEQVGTHPLASTAGAAGGAVAGAIGGLAAGPVGSLVGAIGGAAMGGMLGASAGSGPAIDTTEYESWWRANYASRPYVRPGAPYDDYEAAYRYGMRRYLQTDRPLEWSEVETDLRAGWQEARGPSRLGWEEAKPAVRDAWDHMRNPPPDFAPSSRGLA